MHENHLYNLMLQATQENKALWRIQNHYLKDAEDCAQCQEFWKKLEKDKEVHVADLTKMIKEHLD